jgi:hypothetical protein
MDSDDTDIVERLLRSAPVPRPELRDRILRASDAASRPRPGIAWRWRWSIGAACLVMTQITVVGELDAQQAALMTDPRPQVAERTTSRGGSQMNDRAVLAMIVARTHLVSAALSGAGAVRGKSTERNDHVSI